MRGLEELKGRWLVSIRRSWDLIRRWTPCVSRSWMKCAMRLWKSLNRMIGWSRPRWTPENRPVVDGSKPASGASAPDGESVVPQGHVTPQVGGHPRGARAHRPLGGACGEKPGLRGYRDMGRLEIVDPGGTRTFADSGLTGSGVT